MQKHGIIEPSNLPQRFFTSLHLLYDLFWKFGMIENWSDSKRDLQWPGLPFQVFPIGMWPISRASDPMYF
jgi:hypothetical protein